MVTLSIVFLQHAKVTIVLMQAHYLKSDFSCANFNCKTCH